MILGLMREQHLLKIFSLILTYVENSGKMELNATVDIKAKQLVFKMAILKQANHLLLNTENFKMRFQTNIIGTQLVLNVSNVLSDGGVGRAEYSYNSWCGAYAAKANFW